MSSSLEAHIVSFLAETIFVPGTVASQAAYEYHPAFGIPLCKS